MPTSASYQTTYVEPTVAGGTLSPLGRWRYKVAGALYVLQSRLREGASAANAQAYVADSSARYLRPVQQAAADLNNQAILTDFQAVDSL